MEAKYNPETTDSTIDIYPLLKFCCDVRSGEFFSEPNQPVTQTVCLPKLFTIDTYDKLIEYVSEMYTFGMILGDEFVIKPNGYQRIQILDTYLKSTGLIHLMCTEVLEKFVNSIHDLTLDTPFGVKIIVK